MWFVESHIQLNILTNYRLILAYKIECSVHWALSRDCRSPTETGLVAVPARHMSEWRISGSLITDQCMFKGKWFYQKICSWSCCWECWDESDDLTGAICRVSATQSQRPWTACPLWASNLQVRNLRPCDISNYPRSCTDQVAEWSFQLMSVQLRPCFLHHNAET